MKTLFERTMDAASPNRFVIKRFKDGDNIGLPSWAKHLLIGGFGSQGWNAYDQNKGGAVAATGKWGDALIRKPDGSISCDEYEARAALSPPQATGSEK